MKTSQTQALRKLIILSLLVAMTFVLDRFLSFMTPVMKVGFMFIPPMIAGILYGPVEGMIVYAVGDLLGALLIPKGAPLIGLTVCYALSGIIYGFFLNEKPLKLFGINFTWKKVGLIPNVLIASALVCFVVDLFLKTAVLKTPIGACLPQGCFPRRSCSRCTLRSRRSCSSSARASKKASSINKGNQNELQRIP